MEQPLTPSSSTSLVIPDSRPPRQRSDRWAVMWPMNVWQSKAKLKGRKNFEEWYTTFEGTCKMERTWGVASGRKQKPEFPVTTNEQQLQEYEQALEEWEEQNEVVDGLIRLSIKPGPLAHVKHLTNAAEMLEKLKKVYATNDITARYIAFRQITRSSLSQFEGIREYAEALKNAQAKLEELGYGMSNWEVTSSFLAGLGRNYERQVDRLLLHQSRDENGKLIEPDMDYFVEQLVDRAWR